MRTPLNLLPLLLLLVLALPAVAQAQYTYITNAGAITITGYTGPGGAVTIPSTINGLPVTSIADYAFAQQSSLTSVTVLNSVTNIGNFAFAYCTSLTSVTIPNSVIQIGTGAFSECTSLINVTIPNSVTQIGSGAFSSCTSLINVVIGSGVTTIGGQAFASCTNLTNVTIPNSVTSIQWRTFGQCFNLTNVIIGAGVTRIASAAFTDCLSLRGVYFLSNAPTVEWFSSSESGNLVSHVYYLPGTTGWGPTFIGLPTALWPIPDWSYRVSGGKITLTEYTGADEAVSIPSTIFGVPVTGIGDGAFRFCYDLTSVTIPNGVTFIGSGAFADCWGLQSVTLPGSLTTIGSGAFADCWNLQTIVIPDNVTNIGGWAFRDCTSLTGIYFKGNSRSVSLNVFYNDSATVYYQPGTTGWGATFAGRPTALWSLPYPLILNNGFKFGVQTNKFGFTISWATNISVVVEASTNLASPVWSPVATNTLIGGTSYFSDPQWTNSARRFYRLRSP